MGTVIVVMTPGTFYRSKQPTWQKIREDEHHRICCNSVQSWMGWKKRDEVEVSPELSTPLDSGPSTKHDHHRRDDPSNEQQKKP